jgi:predicted aconitase with swiveling domain
MTPEQINMAIAEIEGAIIDAQHEVVAEKLAGNIVKEKYARGMESGLRLALAHILKQGL